jgi:hypothetical protein
VRRLFTSVRSAFDPTPPVTMRDTFQTRRIAVLALAMAAGISALPAFANETAVALPLNDASVVTPHNVTVNEVHYAGSDAVELRQTGPITGFDPDTFAFVPGLDFHDGTIEVDVAGSLLPSALPAARGFVGVAFRIAADSGSYACEAFYIRPTNGRAEDQVRRNHATQYFSFPDHDFDRLRREAPGRYESYADVVPDEWIHLRIEVSGAIARLYVNGAMQPTLIVRDLKHGAEAHGTVGLWVGNGTNAHFRNLSITTR